MEVYQFNKSLLDRLQECMNVLSWSGDIPARLVQYEWSAFIEMQIEPAGWQALWRIPRAMCEKLKLRYPVVVFGSVDFVVFDTLNAHFSVIAVQDQKDELPAAMMVRLQDLWPTINQENNALNVERTANCIDQLRFFYREIWFPWDNDDMDDRNWVEENLELRVKFLCELQSNAMSKPLTARIRRLLEETRYLRDRVEHLDNEIQDESDMEEDEELDEVEKNLNNMRVKAMVRMQLRLAVIHSEIDMLLNPSLRSAYEELNFPPTLAENSEISILQTVYLVMSPTTIDNQLLLMNRAKEMMPPNALVKMSQSLLDALNSYHPSAHIYLTPGTHMMQYPESFNSDGSITGITTHKRKNIDINEFEKDIEKIILQSQLEDYTLMTFDGNYKLTNLTLDCKNVVNGLLIKRGKITIKNCNFIGSEALKSRQAIWCNNMAELILEDCIINNFNTGIMMKPGSSVTIKNVKFYNCDVGMEIDKRNTKIKMDDVVFYKSSNCGISINSLDLGDEVEDSSMKFEKLCELEKYKDISFDFETTGKCTFKNCNVNILAMNESKVVVPQVIVDRIVMEAEENEPAPNSMESSSEE